MERTLETCSSSTSICPSFTQCGRFYSRWEQCSGGAPVSLGVWPSWAEALNTLHNAICRWRAEQQVSQSDATVSCVKIWSSVLARSCQQKQKKHVPTKSKKKCSLEAQNCAKPQWTLWSSLRVAIVTTPSRSLLFLETDATLWCHPHRFNLTVGTRVLKKKFTNSLLGRVISQNVDLFSRCRGNRTSDKKVFRWWYLTFEYSLLTKIAGKGWPRSYFGLYYDHSTASRKCSDFTVYSIFFPCLCVSNFVDKSCKLSKIYKGWPCSYIDFYFDPLNCISQGWIIMVDKSCKL